LYKDLWRQRLTHRRNKNKKSLQRIEFLRNNYLRFFSMRSVKTRTPFPASEQTSALPSSADGELNHAKGGLETAKTGKREEKKGGGGRPPKFSEPSRPITLTLPESTLKGLEQINADRGQAIVKLTEQALRVGDFAQSQVEIMEVAADIGMLIVGPSSALRRIPFLHLVEVAPARYLLALDPGNDFKTLEIAIHDVFEDVPESDVRERALISQLLEHIKNVRKASRVRMAEILFVSMSETKR
jgi:hypothetical protein